MSSYIRKTTNDTYVTMLPAHIQIFFIKGVKITIGKWLNKCSNLPEQLIVHEIKYTGPVKPTVTLDKTKNMNQAKNIDVAVMAEKLVLGIEKQALLLGWKAKQLIDLQKTLPCFIPCKIGLITLRSICIELLHPDGSIRGAVTHYNHEVDQLWLKHIKCRSDNDG